METTDAVVVGAGQAGLAMSACLSRRGIDHLVLDRAGVANSWRTERWDSLRLLTPNWLTRLPGWAYGGPDPDGYMTAGEVAAFVDRYRAAIDVPVRAGTTVEAVTSGEAGHVVMTDQGPIGCRAVVIATGACSHPKVPAVADQLPSGIRQLAPIHYRRPADLDDGPVLVVGASASGVQLADELAGSGREVTLAVGSHTRLPRTWHGFDIHWWMDAMGLLDTAYGEVEDITKARRWPSLQLVGSPEHRTLDLNALRRAGVELVGRLVGVDGRRAQLSGSLANLCTDADLKMGRLLDQIDRFARSHGIPCIDERPAPTEVGAAPNTVELSRYRTVIWATGFQRRYPWLDPSLLDRKGDVVHDGGVLPRPGLYVLGLPFTRRRKSNFIDGVGPDARFLADHLAHHLGHRGAARSLALAG